ncbi:putative dynein heavy chain [Trypanosoma theileri]|uniref:Putative dynein heavy chain n=1 Tax=Trypanosoma theileri TaxID=67003 RepID=A0A1X0P4B6_9TRYP|nr:putative dynein heavy chain [Trypanosoma theileri]ORC91715.1 putative dynein heavy chain [Trypanosoma theileri]
MGAVKSKPVREAPVRYVAKQLPRVDKVPVEQQFKKPEFTARGINKRLDDVNTEPLMYVETSKDASSTELTDHTAPRWYLNTYMEMVDNQRTDQVIISGNLPLSWERDKFEPYALVRGRIDDEDLKWVLAPEQRAKGLDEILSSTKLERSVLQDILDTVELPRTQYRNYKGKLHKSIEDANTHLAARKEQIEKARESEILRQIGYSEEEVMQEEQYLTNRPRGVKTLDDLGASLREKKRRQRAAETNEMEDLLEERRTQQLESGEMTFTESELLEKPEELSIKPKPYGTRKQVYKRIYAADFGKDEVNQVKFQWWLDRTRRIKRAVDTIHGVPVYNERLSANEEQTRKQMREAAEFNFSLAQAQGAKGFTDPRGHYDDFISILRQNKDLNDDSRVEVHEDDVLENDVFRFPHTKNHGPKPSPKRFEDKGEVPEKVCTDLHKLYDEEEATQAFQQGVKAAKEVYKQHAMKNREKETAEKPIEGDTPPPRDPHSEN